MTALEESVSSKLSDMALSSIFVWICLLGQGQPKKNINWKYITLKSVRTKKETIKRTKKQPSELEKIQKITSNKRLISKKICMRNPCNLGVNFFPDSHSPDLTCLSTYRPLRCQTVGMSGKEADPPTRYLKRTPLCPLPLLGPPPCGSPGPSGHRGVPLPLPLPLPQCPFLPSFCGPGILTTKPF